MNTTNFDSILGWHVFLVKLSWKVGTDAVKMSVAEFIKSESHFSTLQHQYFFLISAHYILSQFIWIHSMSL